MNHVFAALFRRSVSVQTRCVSALAEVPASALAKVGGGLPYYGTKALPYYGSKSA
jgi:hypothetical protein